MKVCFAGDVFLGGDLLNKSCKNVVEVEAFNKADVRIVNLEQPISDSDFVEDKCTLYTGSFAINQLTDLKLKENDIPTSVFYPIPLHLQECFQYLKYKKNDFPISEKASNEAISIPMNPFLTDKQISYIIFHIKENL